MNVILISIFLSLLIAQGGVSLSLLLFLKIFLINFIIILFGSTIVNLSQLKSIKCFSLLSFLMGFFVSSFLVLLFCILFKITALTAFMFVFFICLILFLKNYQPVLQILLINKNNMLDTFSLFIFILFTLVWCWKIAGSLPNLINKGELLTWVDAYTHGSIISQFFDKKAVGNGDIFLSGKPIIFYHYGFYVLPAVFAELAHLTGLAAITTIVIPCGVLLLGVAIYLLGCELGNRSSGMLAFFFILVLPDSSMYWLHNGFLGFHYTLQVAPGMPYGLSACLLSLLFFIKWLNERSMHLWLIAFIFASFVFIFRVHFFVVYFPAFILASLLLYSKENYKKYSLITFSLIFVFFLIVFFNRTLHDFWLSHSSVITFLDLVHLERGVTSYKDFYQFFSEFHKPVLTAIIGTVLFFAAILGVWFFIYPLLFVVKAKKLGISAIDLFPIILFISYIFVILFAPKIFGASDELQHRPLGIIYSILIIFSLINFLKLIDFKSEIFSAYFKNFVMIIMIGGLFGTVCFPQNKLARKVFRGSSKYQDYHIPVKNKETVQVGLFLRKAAKSGDVFLTSDDDSDELTIDSADIITSLSGMPSFLTRPEVEKNFNFNFTSLIQFRQNIRNLITAAPSSEKAFGIMKANHISWYIALSPPKWDLSLKQCNKRYASLGIYHIINTSS